MLEAEQDWGISPGYFPFPLGTDLVLAPMHMKIKFDCFTLYVSMEICKDMKFKNAFCMIQGQSLSFFKPQTPLVKCS